MTKPFLVIVIDGGELGPIKECETWLDAVECGTKLMVERSNLCRLDIECDLDEFGSCDFLDYSVNIGQAEDYNV